MAVFFLDTLKSPIFLALAYIVSGQLEIDRCVTFDGDTSKCIIYTSCKHINDVIDQSSGYRLNSSMKALLRLYFCGFDNDKPKVCCPLKPIVEPKAQLRSRNKCDPEKCVRFSDCKTMTDVLNLRLTTELKKLLKSLQCGLYNANEPKVCCLETIIPEPPIVNQHRKIHLLPKECGQLPSDSRIVGGNKTSLFEFPWMALLSYKTRRGPVFNCGGTILNNRYILTAAHCITHLNTPLIGVRVGEHDINKLVDCEEDEDKVKVCAPPFTDLAIEEIIPHPDYNKETFSDDIGLLRVSQMNLTLENVRPVCLPLGNTRRYDYTGRKVVVTGWGVNQTDGLVRSSELLKTNIPVMTHLECVKAYATLANITYLQLCAGDPFKTESCAGDSGGPLQVNARLNGDVRQIQQGIVSFGSQKCGLSSLPRVYTRVAYYMDWILDNINP